MCKVFIGEICRISLFFRQTKDMKTILGQQFIVGSVLSWWTLNSIFFYVLRKSFLLHHYLWLNSKKRNNKLKVSRDIYVPKKWNIQWRFWFLFSFTISLKKIREINLLVIRFSNNMNCFHEICKYQETLTAMLQCRKIRDFTATVFSQFSVKSTFYQRTLL